jgi:hypothetical protein
LFEVFWNCQTLFYKKGFDRGLGQRPNSIQGVIMNILPAIDLLGGCAVRLLRGDYAQATTYSDSPLSVARDFAARGAEWLHLVDLDGAKSGGTPNADTVAAIAAEGRLKIEIGGGVRSLDVIERYLSLGVTRVILGTAAITDPVLLETAAAKYGDYAVKSSYFNHPSFAYGITGSWNLFRGFGSLNELRRRKALEQAAFWGLNKKYLDVTTEVRDALDYCRNTRTQIDIFRSMKDWVLEQRNLIYSEYINGRETISRLNQAQSDLVEAQSSLALWQIQARKAEAQLNAALGIEK